MSIRQENKNNSEKLKNSKLIFSYQAGSPTDAAGLPETVEQIREGYGELTEDENSIVLLAYKDSKLV